MANRQAERKDENGTTKNHAVLLQAHHAQLTESNMIHVTFSNGETALFEANERIWVYEFIVHGEYIIGDKHIHGFDLLNPKLVGWYILQGDNEDMFVMVDSPIKSVRRL